MKLEDVVWDMLCSKNTQVVLGAILWDKTPVHLLTRYLEQGGQVGGFTLLADMRIDHQLRFQRWLKSSHATPAMIDPIWGLLNTTPNAVAPDSVVYAPASFLALYEKVEPHDNWIHIAHNVSSSQVKKASYIWYKDHKNFHLRSPAAQIAFLEHTNLTGVEVSQATWDTLIVTGEIWQHARSLVQKMDVSCLFDRDDGDKDMKLAIARAILNDPTLPNLPYANIKAAIHWLWNNTKRRKRNLWNLITPRVIKVLKQPERIYLAERTLEGDLRDKLLVGVDLVDLMTE